MCALFTFIDDRSTTQANIQSRILLQYRKYERYELHDRTQIRNCQRHHVEQDHNARMQIVIARTTKALPLAVIRVMP